MIYIIVVWNTDTPLDLGLSSMVLTLCRRETTMTDKNPMRSLDRALDVMAVLQDADGPLRLTDVARRSDLHLATAQRILGALRARHWVSMENGTYSVGLAAVIGANAFRATNRLVNEVRPFMQVLSSKTALVVSLHMRLGFSRINVERVGGDESVQYSGSIGRKLPLHLGAAKIIAAYLPDQLRSEFVAVTGDHIRADGTAVSQADFAMELAQIRRQGYAVASQERIPGRFSIGAPIETEPGIWDAALIISGRELGQYDAALQQITIDVREAAAEISSRRLRTI